MNKNTAKQSVYLIMPAVIFYCCYLYADIIYAVIVSFLFSFGMIIFNLVKRKRIANTQILGITGVAMALIAVIYTDNENFYYVPALVSNCVLFVFMFVLSVKKKSVLHYITKDFDIRLINNIQESDCLQLNYLWLIFFILKIISKVTGILFLDFKVLYWIVFILGDPMMIALAAYSIFFINRKVKKINLT